jgi:hypothetical protein
MQAASEKGGWDAGGKNGLLGQSITQLFGQSSTRNLHQLGH